MARFVVLSFESDDAAEAFCEDQKGTVKFKYLDDPEDPKSNVNEGFFKIVALTIKPTMFCTCKSVGKRTSSYAKGKKWGLWIHAGCGKPSLRWGSSYKAVLSSAKNILWGDEDSNPYMLTHEEKLAVARGEYIGHKLPPPPHYDQEQMTNDHEAIVREYIGQVVKEDAPATN